MRSPVLLIPVVLLCSCELTTGLSDLEKDPDFNPDAAIVDTGTSAVDSTAAADTGTMMPTDTGTMMPTDSGMTAMDTKPPADTGGCTEPEAKTVGAKCYFPIKMMLSFNEAKAACVAKGGRLAIIKTMALNEAISSIDSASERWIGLSKPTLADTNTKDNYKWVDGSAFDPTAFDGFAAGEPNDTTGNPAARFRGTDGLWYDRVGSTGTTAGIHALCEK